MQSRRAEEACEAVQDLAELAVELKAQGNRLMADGQAAAAELVYTEALRHAPQSHSVFANRALARCRLGRPQEGLEDALRVVSLAPQWAKGHARLGAALQACSRFADAAAAFERAAWLAHAHDRDAAAQQEYELAAQHAKTAGMARTGRGNAAGRDGF